MRSSLQLLIGVVSVYTVIQSQGVDGEPDTTGCDTTEDHQYIIEKPKKTRGHEDCKIMCSGTDRCLNWTWNKKNKKCHLIRYIPMDEMAGHVQSGNCPGTPLNSVIVNKFSQKVVNGKISCGIYKSSISKGDSTTYIPCEDTTITGPYRGGNECAGYSGKSNNKYVIQSNGANGCEIVYNSTFIVTENYVYNDFTSAVDITLTCATTSYTLNVDATYQFTPCSSVKVTGSFLDVDGNETPCLPSYNGKLVKYLYIKSNGNNGCKITAKK